MKKNCQAKYTGNACKEFPHTTVQQDFRSFVNSGSQHDICTCLSGFLLEMYFGREDNNALFLENNGLLFIMLFKLFFFK